MTWYSDMAVRTSDGCGDSVGCHINIVQQSMLSICLSIFPFHVIDVVNVRHCCPVCSSLHMVALLGGDLAVVLDVDMFVG